MRVLILFIGLVSGLLGGSAVAQLSPVEAHKLGFAQETGMLFGTEATREMAGLVDVALLVGVIMAITCIFVLALLLWVVFRYNARVNKVASTTTHSTILEVLWTGIPTVLVIFIGFIGVRQIIELERTPNLGLIAADGTMNDEEVILDINVYGMPSWSWEYEITYFGDEGFAADNPDFYAPDRGTGVLNAGYRFISNMLEHPDWEKRSPVPEADVDAVLAQWAALGRDEAFYQFDVDNRLVIPSGVRIQVNVQGPLDTDKQHAWAVPAFGVKRDFWPGRTNSAHFFVEEGNEGLYFGQCSEFCGANHAFMPIAVHVVTLDEFRSYFKSQMAAALSAAETGGLFVPEYLPLILPAPFAPADDALAQL